MANKKSFALHKLHTLLGLFPIGLFVVFHLTANFQATKGPEAFNSAVQMIEHAPFLLFLEFGLIYLPILFHAIYGLYLAFQGKPNNSQFKYYRNQMYLLQRVTGVITLIFVAWHVWQTRIQKAFGAEVNFDMMADILSNPFMIVFYAVGILSAVFHLSNGIWSFLVHWGITVGPRSQRFASIFSMIVFVALSYVGLRAMFAFV
ncbi:succinate dehydrogenase cytochrome b558 subunit [Brevibacillus daliensis]|uniref:succinate dehydrogenase cytochrome b558 subunit n=1 Tax=Brevibacillus daliensis TaxID=2892995 RepID=UPI001E58E8A7|nr:succinate dehydrogenase cytochrome b558 subunit [Brevibacillus daliensis]